ncbi:MAG: M20/M25/M40 family metallo-hydrolase [Niabella sp.]
MLSSMYRQSIFVVIWFCLGASAMAQQINEAQIRKDIAFLASDKMKGRGTGSKEGKKASKFIAKQFKQMGLKPLGTKGFYQPFQGVVRKVPVKDSVRDTRNVIGFLDNHAEKTIIIGAHYDHLGMGYQGSSKDSLPQGKIHNGADDNASGVAGLLQLAKYYTKNNVREPFNFLFISFGAEELGLQGSKYFVAHPTIDLKQVHFMLNMDMIGRYDSSRGLGVGGYGTASEWPAVFEKIARPAPVKFFTDNSGKGGSDHHVFYMAGMPVLFFHTGGHPDYHMPTDDADKVNYLGMKGVLRLGVTIIDAAMQQQRLSYVKQE